MINFDNFNFKAFLRYCFYGSCFSLGLYEMTLGNIFEYYFTFDWTIAIIGAVLFGISVFATFILKELIRDLFNV